MNIKNVVLINGSEDLIRSFNIFYQYECSKDQILVLEAYKRIKRSKKWIGKIA